jgi:AcrR family transcriptional regulator
MIHPQAESLGSNGRKRAANLREEQKLFTRRLFVEAAHTVFATRGYGAATVDDIVKAAGASRATFYLHFTNKAEVMAALSQALMPATAEYWRKLNQGLSSRQTLRAWLDEALSWWEQHRRILPAMHEAWVIDPTLAAQQYEGLRRLTDELTDYFAQVRGVKRRAARLRIELLILQLDQFCMHWIVQKTVDVDRELALDVLTDLWCAALQIPLVPRTR